MFVIVQFFLFVLMNKVRSSIVMLVANILAGIGHTGQSKIKDIRLDSLLEVNSFLGLVRRVY